jgi:hypothetical protein
VALEKMKYFTRGFVAIFLLAACLILAQELVAKVPLIRDSWRIEAALESNNLAKYLTIEIVDAKFKGILVTGTFETEDQLKSALTLVQGITSVPVKFEVFVDGKRFVDSIYAAAPKVS